MVFKKFLRQYKLEKNSYQIPRHFKLEEHLIKD